MNIDFSRDYLAWTNTVPVVIEYARRNTSVANNDQQLRCGGLPPPYDQSRNVSANILDSVAIAKRSAITSREKSPSNGVYIAYEATWRVPAALLPTERKIEERDVLIEKSTGTRWTVQTADLKRNLTTWVLGCINLSLAFDLRDAINVERPAVSYDDSGAVVKAWPTGVQPLGGVTLYAALPSRVQLQTKELKEEREIRGLERRYDIIVSREVDVSNEDRVFWNGLYLDIVGYRNPERLDELPVIEALGKV